jgi:ABC-type lipoprotein export system ATPase subunit
MAKPLVICDNLVKIYKVSDLEVVALQGLDLEVASGEMLAIVGASGSGKSTLLNILSGLDIPSAGRATVSGYDLTRLTEMQRIHYRRFMIGHVWQQSGRNLLQELTSIENIEAPQLIGGYSAKRRMQRCRELLDLVELQHLAHKYPNQLSGGEQQRIAIAVSLANEPRLLLADEPTGELDSVTAGEIITLLHSLSRKLGLTIIVVTHDAGVATVADRTIAIRDGRRRPTPMAS